MTRKHNGTMDDLAFMLRDEAEGRIRFQHCDFYDSLSPHQPTICGVQTPSLWAGFPDVCDPDFRPEPEPETAPEATAEPDPEAHTRGVKRGAQEELDNAHKEGAKA